MRAERRAIMFDSETSTFPNRHDELILEEFGRIAICQHSAVFRNAVCSGLFCLCMNHDRQQENANKGY